MTRKLTIRTKLAATLAVPLAALAAFAAFQVRNSYDAADRVKRQAGVATSATGPSGVVDALITERDFETLRVLGQKADRQLGVKNSRTAEDATDRKVGAFRNQLKALGRDVAGSYTPALALLSNKLDGQDGLRGQVEDLSSKASPANAKPAAAIFNGYTELVNGLLDADQRSGSRIDDAQLGSGVALLNALNRQKDLESRIAVQGAIASLSGDANQARDLPALAGLQAAGAHEVAVEADGPYANAVAGSMSSSSRTKAVADLQSIAKKPSRWSIPGLLATLQSASSGTKAAVSNVAGLVNERAAKLTAAAQDEEKKWIAVTIASVLLAIALLWLTSRWITRPLRALADQARAMAGERLPNAVHEILSTPPGEEVQSPEVEPVDVNAGGEVRDVEVALNKVQDSAIALAVEQAQLRGKVADAFVNLGRRNQNLLSRQLEFITQLENEESDPETLEHLFRLDHLATRMRRNAESLLVLAGHEPPRTWGAPVEIGDVVRGALGEVEGYQRVRLRHLDEARVDGSAAVDVSHVIAELVENALAFSPPESDVDIYGRDDEYGYVLTIVDTGIGMPPEDLERANALIQSADVGTFAPSRFLGHYVVAQLAARHGLTVHLAASPTGGLTAMVALAPRVVGRPEAVATPFVVPEANAELERPVAALPKRESLATVAESEAPSPDVEIDDADEHEPTAVEPLALVVPLPQLDPWPELVPPAEVEPPVALLPKRQSADPAPEPELVPPLAVAPAPVREPLAFAPEPEPEPEPEPVPEAEPATEPPRPRIGIGTFADLRATPAAAPRVAPEPEPDPGAVPAPPAAVSPDAPAPPPDKAAAFAEVAGAVDAVTGAPPAPSAPAVPASVFSEELLPSKLPKRGRRGSKAGTPWAREKPATPAVPPPAFPTTPVHGAPPAAAAHVAPPQSAHPAPGTHEPTPGALHFKPGGPAMGSHGEAAPPADANGAHSEPQPAPTGDRFAFFAAFRAAAEQAREEAGIDDRRVGQ